MRVIPDGIPAKDDELKGETKEDSDTKGNKGEQFCFCQLVKFVVTLLFHKFNGRTKIVSLYK